MEQAIVTVGVSGRVSFMRLWLQHLAEVQESDEPLVGLHISVCPAANQTEQQLISAINGIAQGVIAGGVSSSDLSHDEELLSILSVYEKAYPENGTVLMAESVCQDFMVGQYCLKNGLYKTVKSDADLPSPRKISPEAQARIDRTMTDIACRLKGEIFKHMSLVAI